MKRRLFSLGLLLLVVVVLLWGNRITETQLDERLAPLLTEVLGLPVSIEPTSVNLLSLRARTPRLIMGDPADPAIDAVDIKVNLSWVSLIRGEIRLHYAQAKDLKVKVDAWPRSGNPLPDNYQFLDQWIPAVIRVREGRYVRADDIEIPLRQAQWTRLTGGGATTTGTTAFAGRELDFSLRLASLQALLDLKDFQLRADIAGSGISAGQFNTDISITPTQTAYAVDSTWQLFDSHFRLSASGEAPWVLPGRSRLDIEELAPAKLFEQLGIQDEEPVNIEQLLASPVPELNLIEHVCEIEIGKLHIADLYAVENRATLTSSAQGLVVDDVFSRGPAGEISAAGSLQKSEDRWAYKLSAQIDVRDDSKRLTPGLLASDWYWTHGDLEVSGYGKRWGELFDSTSGLLHMEGSHQANAKTPIKIRAELGARADLFSLENIDIQLGESRIVGRAELPGDAQRILRMDLQADPLDLQFLFDGDLDPLEPGVEIPTFLGLYPEIELDWNLELGQMRLPGLNLKKTSVTVKRDDAGGQVIASATGQHDGSIDTRLEWQYQQQDRTDVRLRFNMNRVDLQEMFTREAGFLRGLTSGSLDLSANSNNIPSLFADMRGEADLLLELRNDNDWARDSTAFERIELRGESRLIMNGDKILGFRVDDLQVASLEQDVTGSLSIAAGRDPWMEAKLRSDGLNVTRLLDALPASTDQADKSNLLDDLRRFGPMRITLDAREVTIEDSVLNNVRMDLSKSGGSFSLSALDFSMQGHPGRSTNSARLSWKDEIASFEAKGSLHDVVLDQFLQTLELDRPVPLSGSLSLNASGRSIDEMARSASGALSLNATTPPARPEDRRRLNLKLERVTGGVEAKVETLVFGRSDLQGSARLVEHSSGEELDIKLLGGHLELKRWESQLLAEQETDKEEADTVLDRAASTSSSLLRNLFTAPSRFMEGEAADEDEDADSKRLLSANPLQTDFQGESDLRVRGRLDSIRSDVFEATGVSFDFTNLGASLKGSVSAEAINGGQATLTFEYARETLPSQATMSGELINVQENAAGGGVPNTAFFNFHSSGESLAELGQGLDGQIYLEGGQGPIDYGAVSFLTADVAQTMFRSLIPGAKQRQPTLSCAVTLGVFEQGLGNTPYGYAGQTRTANLLGTLQLDLHKEKIRVEFDSRSREGVGLSLGNMFSNTIRIEGPINDPAVIPNTTSLVARGWAAFATAGLSMVGEGMLRRVLASEDPCEDIRVEIREDVCGGDSAAAHSAIVCPQDAKQVDDADTSEQQG